MKRRTQSFAWAATLVIASVMAIAIPAMPQSCTPPILTGTYSGDDGGMYYVQQSGSILWWAGLSSDSGLNPDAVWHRGLEFTNVFRGTINCDYTVTGNWADVARGSILQSGTLKLSISYFNGNLRLTVLTETGNFGGTTLTQRTPLDDTKQDGLDLDIIARMDAVVKNKAGGQGTLEDNLKTYRDQTVVYGRVVNEHVDNGNRQDSLPHIAFGPPNLYTPGTPATPFTPAVNPSPIYFDFSQPARDFKTFACYDQNDGNGDGDIDIGLSLDTDRLEDYFWSTGWGDHATGPTVFSLKFGYTGDQNQLNYGAFIHPEGIMYGKVGQCDSPSDSTFTSLLPGWADLNGNSILINGRPINGQSAGNNCNSFIEPCPFLGGATSYSYLVSPIGLELKDLLVSQYGGGSVGNVEPDGSLTDSAGTYVRITGALVVDCGHGATSPCFDDTSDPDDVYPNQNQEIHPIYSIDVINSPFRPEDYNVAARSNLTGAWGGTDGSTYYVRQIGNTIWWLGMMRDRQPMQPGTAFPIIGYNQLQNAPDASCASTQCWIFANVFKGTISNNSDGSATIQGDWAGVPQSTSQGSTGSAGVTFYVNANHKAITPITTGIFPNELAKMYEPEDTTPPESALTIANPQYSSDAVHNFVNSTTEFTASGTDSGSGMQNLWYRFFPSGSAAPAYTPAVGSSTMFALTGSDGLYELDTYATDNAGNDENPHSESVYLDNTPPVTSFVAPIPAPYGHSDSITLNYSLSDGAGSGVNVSSITPKMDGQSSAQFGTGLGSGQIISLESLSLGAHTFSVDSTDNLSNAGTNSATFTIAVTFASLQGDINNLASAGCIANLGQSLIAKFSAAQGAYGRGQMQTAINILWAALYEVQAQAGKHIATVCKDPTGRSFNPVNLLTGDIQYMQGTLAAQLKADPIVGSVASSGNLPVSGATVNLLSGKALIGQTTTDSVGFYYFADVSSLGQSGNYAITVMLPKGFKNSTPAAQTFTWTGNMVVSGFLLN